MHQDPIHKKPYFHRKRNELLSAIFRKKYRMVENIYRDIYETIERTDEFPEIGQKAINQIQHIFRRFRQEISENCSADIKNMNERIRKKITDITKNRIHNIQYVSYDAWYRNLGLTKLQFSTMLKHVSSLQITTGCRNHCRRCNEWALPGARKHFTFWAVKKLITQIVNRSNQGVALYSASDPLDWRHGKHNIIDIINFMSEQEYQSDFSILTKIPMGSQKIAETLLKMNVDISVSITQKNREKIRRIEKKIGRQFSVQHDVDELTIAAGLDEDFQSIKSSITDNYGVEITPEGACLIVPTLTSALHLTGQCRIPVTEKTGYFLLKKVGRAALPVEYFKPLVVENLQGMTFRLDQLLDPQIETILLDNRSEQLVPPGMTNLETYFKTFEPDAVMRRKRLFRSILLDMQKSILSEKTNGKNTPRIRIGLFRRHVRKYLDFTRMDTVETFKKNAFSYYLKTTAQYLRSHSIEREIIKELRKKDSKPFINKYKTMMNQGNQPVDTLLAAPGIGTFAKFQLLLTILIEHPDNRAIQQFIDRNPVSYDPEVDQFVCD